MAESEADTPSTPSELLENRYFEFHNVRLPPFCRGAMDDVGEFPVRRDDVWLVTYPKSVQQRGPHDVISSPSTATGTVVLKGTSLLQEVVYVVSRGAEADESALINIDDFIPVLEYPQPGIDAIKEMPSPRIIKSHLPFQFLPQDLHAGKARVIYMARNPKDLVVSYYQFHRSLRSMSYRGTFQEFCRRFIYDKLGYGSWFGHVQAFWSHRKDDNVLFLKYEDLHKDLSGALRNLVAFLGVKYNKEQMDGLHGFCQQLIDQRCNTDALPIGRGRIGLWKDIFTVSMNERFDSVYKQKMGKCDINFDFQA